MPSASLCRPAATQHSRLASISSTAIERRPASSAQSTAASMSAASSSKRARVEGAVGAVELARERLGARRQVGGQQLVAADEVGCVSSCCAGERADGAEHHEPHLGAALHRPDEPRVHDRRDRLDDAGDVGTQGLDGLDGEPALEQRQPVAHQPRLGREAVVAPRDRGRQGPRGGPVRRPRPADRAVELSRSPSMIRSRLRSLTRAAASSRASGRPSSRKHSRATSRSCPASRKSGSADLRPVDEQLHRRRRRDGGRVRAPCRGRRADPPACTCSPSSQSGSRLVTSRVSAADASSRRRTTSGPSSCASRLSSTTSGRRSSASSASDVARSPLGCAAQRELDLGEQLWCLR